MAYDDFELSAQDGEPVFRFLFAIGPVEYKFTTEPYIIDGWVPSPIQADKFEQTQDIAKAPLKLKFPRDNEFAVNFLGGVPDQITTLTVYRGHRVDSDFRVYWKGRITGVSADNDEITFETESVFASLKRSGVYARYQRTCRHALYDGGCKVDKSLFETSVDVSSVSGTLVSVSGFDLNSLGTGYFAGGMLVYNGVYRHIVSHEGSTLILIRDFRLLADAGPVTVSLHPGCDHTRPTCLAKFNNVLNFGGFPWMPSKNPFGNDVTGSIA